ncbi:ribbon-helix-helix domain-containing protein [Clostridium tagluense]|uniref:ribbon-helix-helix domain-containing protein n=1 Tax=Clostridium tagluense TaxID=360422 RepID=UPI001C6E2D7F|nr:DNA-binding protein [Clostridium tagluense]MBW9154892.1 DNA-binding protein [Clostridium tagluense]WLC64347.1 DNA-binding protein [Clostridium tagluense]
MMAIPEGKERLILTLPKELKEKLLNICEQEKRTPSKQVEVILEKFIEGYDK